MKRKVGKETERGSKKRKEVGNDNSLASMYVCKSDTGMSVENVPTFVNITTPKGRFIAHKFSTGWAVGVVKCVEKKKSVVGRFSDFSQI